MTKEQDVDVEPGQVIETVPESQLPAPRHEPMIRSFEDVVRFAGVVKGAQGMIPKAYLNNEGKIIACVLAGQELGIGPMAALRAFHIVEGKPVADYTFWVARLKAAGYRVEWPERTPERVTLKLTDREGASATETWDKARAITAGLWNSKDNWKKYPQTMLAARCVTSLGRSFAGEVMFGCYETDEKEEVMRDADFTETKAIEGSAAERINQATGGKDANPEVAAREKLAHACADLAKQLEMSRDDVFYIFTELGIPHTDKTTISKLPKEHLDQLWQRMKDEAEVRGQKTESTDS